MNINSPQKLTTLEARKAVSQGIESEIRALQKSVPWHHFLYLIFPLTAVVGVSVEVKAYTQGLSWNLATVEYGFGVILVALAMNAMFLLIHEGVHDILFPQKWLNDLAATVMGIAGFISFSAYRSMHLRHHEHLGDENDPDDYHNYTNNPKLIWLLHYNRLLWATILYLIFVPSLAWRYGNTQERIKVFTEYLFLIVTYIIIWQFVPLQLFFITWVVPFILTNFTINIRGLTQHGITDATDPFLASRSIEAHPIVQFLLVHENFHLEHHLFPSIPSYNLPKLHKLILPRIHRRVTGKSYSSFLWKFVRASLRQDETPIGLEITPTK
ncbi:MULTISPECIES: fatty acid desaturase [unclassified Nodularia (in: cyanobacteria)]|uniref:fatty acid desaturase family protein n=1 Tax=unclassified Nodularia (in: cyanobacteria) TaxID=2656917 RepID=UPI001882E954|nr:MULTISPECIES: fatty acid desaturase [unclassified Nodularia (in: cyanobacteria)]MBE9198496.1 fatty acid desaturase [Nodularia sp. LEGE 06071]MCC2691039.1 fatty acid desaturase [Nodularia sp. LEGE 04288]